jgi:hypothetical protein
VKTDEFWDKNRDLRKIVLLWEECQARHRNPDISCPLEHESHRNYFYEALSAFRNAQRSNLVEAIRTFLALPYWRKRWEFYEVWFVMLVLRSFGLARLQLQIDNNQWHLKVGGVGRLPIASGRMDNDKRIEFYYQFEGVPPQGIVPNAKDRPELLVFGQGSANIRRCLLAVEVKARERRGFDIQAMKGETLALLEWSPMAILGGSYFQLSRSSTLFKQQFGGSQVVIADGCSPGSLTTSELYRWLDEFWMRVTFS